MPSLAFTAAAGDTPTVCVPFQLLATAADADGVVTNLAMLLDGAAIASGNPESFRGCHPRWSWTFRAHTCSPRTRMTTQAAYPLHWIISGGFRTNRVFKLCMAGETSRSYQVLASMNLAATNWLPIGVIESTNGIWRFLDTGASNQPLRFYRAEQLP
ncbi:MAG: hypothetical protein HY298_27095 [Verrucomicrobia bacterium]|nr:hypothetical protein [Verrucomicrobiota bacterium]